MEIMGWSSSAMAKRYQHLTHEIRKDIARRVGGLLWETGSDQDDDGAAECWRGLEGERMRPELRPLILIGDSSGRAAGVLAGCGGGGYEIRTREGFIPTRFPSVRPRPLGESSARQDTQGLTPDAFG